MMLDSGPAGSMTNPFATGARRGKGRGLNARPGRQKPTITPYPQFMAPAAPKPSPYSRSSSGPGMGGAGPRSVNVPRGRGARSIALPAHVRGRGGRR